MIHYQAFQALPGTLILFVQNKLNCGYRPRVSYEEELRKHVTNYTLSGARVLKRRQQCHVTLRSTQQSSASPNFQLFHRVTLSNNPDRGQMSGVGRPRPDVRVRTSLPADQTLTGATVM